MKKTINCIRCNKELIPKNKKTKYCSFLCVRMMSPVKKHNGLVLNKLLYWRWKGIKQRCYNLKNPSYKYYGGSGVTVCNEWYNDFINFRDWSLKNGYKKGLEIDRINPFGSYTPENCRWVNKIINARNKRKTKRIEMFGETKTFAEWLEDNRCKTTFSSFWHRVKRGWNCEIAFTTPLSFIR